jgi:antitoxin (DNA-binding transcriptional repressor) of toxin-antitoxin stability system
MGVAKIEKLTEDLRSLLDEARLSGESIEIIDNGEIVAHIIPSPRGGALFMTVDQLAQRRGRPFETHPDDSEPSLSASRRAQTEAVLASMDRIAEEIDKVWPKNVSALDAINDVRREL